MDDFLHNLRSGKLKQQSGGNRPFSDPQYKGGVRRNQMDRRNKGHHDNKESSERLNAIKEVLENLERTQRQMAEAYTARTRAEERKARALEILAKNLYKMLNPNAEDVDRLFAEEPAAAAKQINTGLASSGEMRPIADSQDEDIDTKEETYPIDRAYADVEDADADLDEVDEVDDDDATDEQTDEEDEDMPRTRGRLTEVDRHTLYAVISQMREAGEGWEKIARHIASQGYPTVSGKGSWRGVMVKTLFEKMDEQ